MTRPSSPSGSVATTRRLATSPAAFRCAFAEIARWTDFIVLSRLGIGVNRRMMSILRPRKPGPSSGWRRKFMDRVPGDGKRKGDRGSL